MRVFLDANILFSASLPKSRLAEFIELLQLHGDCLYSAYALDEAKRNLDNKFPTSVPVLEKLTRAMTQVPDVQDVAGITIRSKDKPILSAAVAAKATHLLTGDKRDFGPHFGQTIHGVKVVTPAMLAGELAAKGSLG